MIRGTIGLSILLAPLLFTCSEDGGTGPDPLPECTGAVALEVGSGTRPLFTWTPPCRLFFMIVEPADSGEDLWSIISEGGNRISPDVRYGTVPEGASEGDPPTVLVSGTSYKVAVARFTGPGGDDGELIGLAQFTP